MARYIDVDELIQRIRYKHKPLFPTGSIVDVLYKNIEETINETPTANVAEVVRCKDCIYKTVTGNGEYDPNDIVCGYHMSDGFDSDDYCSYGKRGKST